jgi:hypothetical protein
MDEVEDTHFNQLDSESWIGWRANSTLQLELW